MFRTLKKRVKSLSDSSGHRRSNDSSTLDTPRRETSGSSIASESSQTTPAITTTPNSVSASRAVRRSVKKASSFLSKPDDDNKITYLASFDKCIETSDAITASSSAGQNESVLTARKDVATGLPDCSLLVSPDGDLLLVPTGAGEIPHDMFRIRKVKQSATMEASAGTQNGESLEENDAAQTQENKKSTGASVSVSPLEVCEDGDDDVGLNDIPQHSSFSELMRQSKDDYASAMFLGNDLQGDKALNRFSAKGWSVPATALALQQTGSSLNALAHFCEQIVLSRKECAARTAIACDNLRSESEARRGFNECNNMTAEQWEILDPRATVFELTAGRIGPLASEGSTLHSAVVAVEQYHNLAAEKESKRWRTASLQRTGVLPAMHAAMDQFQERASKRQQTLEETSRKAMLMEVRMRKLKQLSAKRWEAVYKAEDRVTKRLEELMAERSRERQKARFDKILEQQQQQLDQVTSEELTLANNLSEEVWDMVSSVAESMENGSFEPMMADTANAISDEGSTTSLVNLDKEESVPVVLPMACREEIENEVSLPELRAAAMKADDEIQDASDRLLNVLTTLDTTRRSARVAAETCLVSAANAQATCLRSMLELERESLQERLRDLEGLEEVVDKIDVRADIDAYITNDKKERGGLSHLGDDDDGGIASALAILSCHVDGGIGQESSYSSNQARSCNTLTEHSDNDRMASADMLNSAIENLFGENACLAPKTDEDEATVKSRSEFEQNTNFLCQSASGDSASAKARRSTLCYSLNFKRGPNARIATPIQFDAISRVFAAILTGCIDDENGVSNAKMCMMLAQTFFIESPGDVDSDVNLQLVASTQSAQQTRSRRVYVKNKLTNHPIWSRDDFWDAALSQQIAESLAHSGVMSNFERNNRSVRRSEWTQSRKTKWHDLNYTERVEAASQVHAVVFAQLGALAHSMIELGCGLDRSCAFVRRMSIRNQLPSSQRTMLLMHLMDRDDVGRREWKAQEEYISMERNIS